MLFKLKIQGGHTKAASMPCAAVQPTISQRASSPSGWSSQPIYLHLKHFHRLHPMRISLFYLGPVYFVCEKSLVSLARAILALGWLLGHFVSPTMVLHVVIGARARTPLSRTAVAVERAIVSCLGPAARSPCLREIFGLTWAAINCQ